MSGAGGVLVRRHERSRWWILQQREFGRDVHVHVERRPSGDRRNGRVSTGIRRKDWTKLRLYRVRERQTCNTDVVQRRQMGGDIGKKERLKKEKKKKGPYAENAGRGRKGRDEVRQAGSYLGFNHAHELVKKRGSRCHVAINREGEYAATT